MPVPAPAPAAPAAKPTPAQANAGAGTAVVAAAAPSTANAASDSRASASAQAEGEIKRAVQAWAAAWAAQDMKRYLAAYADSFSPAGGTSRSAWEEERRQRIMGKSDIAVEVDQFDIKVDGDKAVARFRQSYRADALNVRSRKTLLLARQNGPWRITREAVGGK